MKTLKKHPGIEPLFAHVSSLIEQKNSLDEELLIKVKSLADKIMVDAELSEREIAFLKITASKSQPSDLGILCYPELFEKKTVTLIELMIVIGLSQSQSQYPEEKSSLVRIDITDWNIDELRQTSESIKKKTSRLLDIIPSNQPGTYCDVNYRFKTSSFFKEKVAVNEDGA